MNYFLTALHVEGLKIRKSKVVWITFAAFTIAPLMAGFFMFVLKHPEFAKNSGLLGAKAQIAGEANWPSYLQLHAQMIAVGGILVFGFVMSWVFGREYADYTAKDLLVLPYSRIVIVIAKFIAASITNIILSTYVVGIGLLIGLIIGLPQWSATILMEGIYVLAIVTILTIALSTPVAFFASYGGGYLAPLGFVIVIAKFIAASITNIILSTYVVGIGLLIGLIIGLPQWSATILMEGIYVLAIVTILTIALSTPVAFFASYGGGYLAPLGFVIVTLVLSQIVAATGYGEYFPWAIPAIYSGLVGSAGLLTSASLIIISITCLFGFFSTLYWWVFADQH